MSLKPIHSTLGSGRRGEGSDTCVSLFYDLIGLLFSDLLWNSKLTSWLIPQGLEVNLPLFSIQMLSSATQGQPMWVVLRYIYSTGEAGI